MENDNGFADFAKDLEDNRRSERQRADFFKLQNGDNKIVILTNPVGYSELFGIGIAYQDCGYGKYATRRYKCYVKDLSDGYIKIANFSYTVAGKIHDLSLGERTKFESFPIPYVVNLKTTKAGTKEVETSVLAGVDYSVTDDDIAELNSFDPIRDILERLKAAQKKKVETDEALQSKIAEFMAKKESDEKATAERKEKDSSFQDKSRDLDTVEYPDEEISLEDIPF